MPMPTVGMSSDPVFAIAFSLIESRHS
jgi:hypothetical protein